MDVLYLVEQIHKYSVSRKKSDIWPPKTKELLPAAETAPNPLTQPQPKPNSKPNLESKSEPSNRPLNSWSQNALTSWKCPDVASSMHVLVLNIYTHTGVVWSQCGCDADAAIMKSYLSIIRYEMVQHLHNPAKVQSGEWTMSEWENV